MTRARVAILISGRGSNMMSLLDAMADEAFPAEPALVLSNRPDAGGLAVAEARGVATAVVDHRAYPDRQRFEIEIHARLLSAKVEIVCLAGFMRILTPWFVEKWEGRMLNIHPSLLPKYPGLDTHARALEAGDAEHGCTVHLVTAGVDEGPILGQAKIPIRPGDDPDALAARVLVEEHKLYPAALRDFINSRPSALDPSEPRESAGTGER
ncbi:MAG: phosphoribosylglycinamide formyltransferase [Maricaulaceae bacterium]|jgi:formyltetrahydrofolate-dependent phosphoribosylglycinamide formyltransferase